MGLLVTLTGNMPYATLVTAAGVGVGLMNRYLVMAATFALGVTAVLASPAGAASASPHTVATGAAWGKTQEVPGTATLNAEGNGSTSSVSCASAGNCSAGGAYDTDSSASLQEAF